MKSAQGISKEELDFIIDSINEFAKENFPDSKLLELDHDDKFPLDEIRQMCGEGLGIHLLFIPEEYDGMGGNAYDVYRICEAMARIDIGVATGVLATFLGSDPILFGGTEAQKEKWLGRIANEGLLMAYGATEPDAGSDLGALRTIAEPVSENGTVTGYRITGSKQWISNGGYADLYSILAKTPGGPTWFILEKGAEGFEAHPPEDKHGIRASNTAALSLDNVYVGAEDLVGGEEGKGLFQAQLVFGYTRLMVAAFGLGGGWAAMDRAIPYSQDRIQAGAPLSEKQGYTHKLIVPHIARLEAARAFIEETAERIDSGEGNLNTEGAIAKYMATEAGNLAADAAIQALGGYGYTREYMVEKYKRDVRITTIYEGTSEIMEMTVGRDRWQYHLKTKGRYYHDMAESLEALHQQQPYCGADIAALACHTLADLLETARLHRLTRNQHLLFRIGELVCYTETAASIAKKAVRHHGGQVHEKTTRRFNNEALAAISRTFCREAVMKVANDGIRWISGAIDDEHILADLSDRIPVASIYRSQKGMIADMDLIADVVYDRVGEPALT
jgi:alkylation response protein AidB-like acyl-CoA dehydrogenase